MKTSMAASLAVSTLLAATSARAVNPISSSSSKSFTSTSLRGSATPSSSPLSSSAPSASPLAEDGGLFVRSRDLQLSPQPKMECYTHPAPQTNDQYVDEYQQVDCTSALLATCGSIYGCVPSYDGAIGSGSAQCNTWTQWPEDQDAGASDDQCVYAFSCCA
jgi:hypothetical protein